MNTAAAAVLCMGLLFSCPNPKTVEDVLPKVGFSAIEPNYSYILAGYENAMKGDIESEIRDGELEMIAQLVRAEAGNQSLEGKRAVVDVILNRVDSPKFPDTIEEVIFQDGQFSVIESGSFDKAGWTVDDTDYEAVRLEVANRTDSTILYFSSGECYNGTYVYTIGDHHFGK